MVSEKCIWMEAGIVEYQLCPLKKNCEVCDFHQEMLRGRRTGGMDRASPLPVKCPDPSLNQFKPGLQYLEGHFWYKHVGENRIRLGIDTLMWQLFISSIKTVFPPSGNALKTGDCFCWIVLSGGIVYLKAPLSGTVTALNPLFIQETINGAQLYLNPEDELWLVEMQTEMDHREACLNRVQYLNRTAEDQDIFRRKFCQQKQGEKQQTERVGVDPRGKFRDYLQSVSKGHAFIC